MAAANITTKYDFQVMHLIPDIVFVAKTTQNDWMSFTKYPGVLVLSMHGFTVVNNATTNAIDQITYGVGKVNNTGTAYTATTTTVAFDGAVATRLYPCYIMTSSGEIMYATADSGATSTSGNLTVRRGCLGTTASATGLADNDPLYFLNQVYFSASGVGKVIMMVYPLPQDPGVKLFAAQNSS
jgi:hypothetical protein